MKVPNGHQTIMPYLMLNNAKDFFDFTRKVFNARETMRKLREDDKTIMHAEILIDSSTIMYSQASTDWKQQNANIFIYVESADETFNKALQMSSKIIMPLADQDYGRTCGIEDPFGNTWWITSQ